MMDLPVGQRSRGVVLSPKGQAKLENRIRQLEIERYPVQEFVRRSQLEGQGLHPATIRKILRGQGVDKDSIALVFKAVGLQMEPEDYTGARQSLNVRTTTQEVSQADNPSPSPPLPHSLTDWGEAVDVSFFCGRVEELAALQEWILKEHCRLVALLGSGGIGKTTLVTKLAEQIQDQFEFVIWRSLRNAPPFTNLLDDLLKFLSPQQTDRLPETKGGKLSKLMELLREHRCLIVLDNLETLMQSGVYAGTFQADCKGYGELLRNIGEVPHQSCLLLTSREKPNAIAMQAGEALPVRTLQLAGLKLEAQKLLSVKGLSVSKQESEQLILRYSGNPLALKIVATTIQELFGGDVSAFLEAGISSFNSIRLLLDRQFERLTHTEKGVIFWLAINREGVSLVELEDDIYPKLLKHQLLEALESLLRRSLIEQSFQKKTMQPAIMEYVTERLVEQVSQEIGEWGQGDKVESTPYPLSPTPLIQTHALLKATAKDYIKDAQIRLIINPILAELLRKLGTKKAIEMQLIQILSSQRRQAANESGYLGGNVLNLLCQLKTDLKGFDFSELPIWQANLQGITLHQVNFARAELSKSNFTQIFGNVLAIAFNSNGEILATGDDKGDIYLWQATDGQLILTLKGHTSQITSIDFHPENLLLVSRGQDQIVKFWDVKTGQVIRTLQRYTSQVLGIFLTHECQILLSQARDNTASLWDIETGQCLTSLQDNMSPINCAAMSSNGHILATASHEEPIRLWDTKTGECFLTLYDHTERTQCMMFSPSSQQGTEEILVTGSAGGSVKLWDIKTGQCLKTLHGHSSQVLCIKFSPDALVVASGSADRTIRLWDTATGQCIAVLQGHTNWVRTLEFNPDGSVLASGGDDRTVKLWDTETNQCLKTLQGYTNQISSVCFNVSSNKSEQSGIVLASGSNDHLVRLWDGETGQCLKVLQGHANQVSAIAFHENREARRILATGSADQTIKLWDVETGQCLRTLEEHTEKVFSVAFNPLSKGKAGGILASGSADCTVRLWELETGRCLRVLQEHEGHVFSVCFSPDGQAIASSSADQTIKFWAVNTGQCFQTLQGHTYWVLCIAFSPIPSVPTLVRAVGGILASGSADQTVRLWDVETGQCLKILQGHNNHVLSVSFSPDGQTLASASADQTVKLWAVNTGQCLKTLRGHTSQVLSINFSPEGNILASSSADETIKLWDINTGDCLMTIRAERPYEGTNITGVTGLSEAQRATLKALGAFE
ncbi:NB-ARC domain-containing protein [Scytonema sp. NUACC21]